MPDLSSLFPLVLATHIGLAIALFVPSLLLPFTLRNRLVSRGYDVPPPGPFVRIMTAMQARGAIVIGIGLALTGALMVVVLGPRMLQQPWLLVSLATYAIVAAIVFAVQRPSLRRLARLGRDRDRRGPRGVARQGAWAAVHGLRDHHGGRPHRLPDVHEAGPVVSAGIPARAVPGRTAGWRGSARPRSAAIVNLGCKVNQSEMEAAARLLREAGVPLVDPRRGRGPLPRQHLHRDLHRRREVPLRRPPRPPREP